MRAAAPALPSWGAGRRLSAFPGPVADTGAPARLRRLGEPGTVHLHG
ncbi:hypothetical protein ACFVUH_07130 [Kitasatospora sp. NPDC058032]